ncbi:MAG: hypothetical protein ABI378_16200 [Chitinophagaceae bacterium]
MAANITIQKNPTMPPGMDYGLLRRTALQHLEQLGSDLWTDFNIHDPGITIMEALCYALSDLSFRANFKIEDLLAEQPNITPNPARQGFFTAREILTISPWTTLDYRKFLVDINGVKNAWLSCRKCPCEDLFLYSNCKKSILQYAPTEHPVIIKGLYDVQVEFEDVDDIGDLNSGRIKYNFSYPIGSGLVQQFANASLELRLPTWQDIEDAPLKFKGFRNPKSKVNSVNVLFISGNKNDNQNIQQKDLGSALRKPLYVTLEISFWPDASDVAFVQTITLADQPLLVWFQSDADRKALLLADLATPIADATSGGIAALFLVRIQKADAVMKATRAALNEHRNLCEDYCRISSVPVQDVAVCADMDVAPDVDIESVVAQAYYLISQYMSPDIKFWSLKELLDAGKTTDEIFNGPQLSNGFIDNDQIAETGLKTELHSSDVLNLLMDIPGVLAIRNFVFSPFDKEGNRQPSESWVYDVPTGSQPRLYIEASKFLVFKNGLPFLPNQLELSDTLQVIRGENAQPNYPLAELDLEVPTGAFIELGSYEPVLYELPQTYGVGQYGLPLQASDSRKANAKQLKAYLLFFEQILVDYLATLSHAKDLFALDETVKQTYFTSLLKGSDIAGLDEIYIDIDGSSFSQSALQKLVENTSQFADRRNRFLDQLLARFAEQFTDYTLMLYAYSNNEQNTALELIDDKISFVNAIPEMTRNRAKSFNAKVSSEVCASDNVAGIAERIARILGFQGINSRWELYEEHDNDGITAEQRWRIRDYNGKILLSSSTRYFDVDLEKARAKAFVEIGEVEKYMTDVNRWDIKKSKQWVLNLTNPTGEIIATRKQPFSKKTDAEAARDYLINFGKELVYGEKVLVVEHLLLRPHNRPGSSFAPDGDTLLPICIGPDCAELCLKDDPYSFRMTLVMNGESGITNSKIEFRRYAERAIRFEIPAHLGLKICWVSTDQLIEMEQKYCAYLAEWAKDVLDKAALSLRLKDLLEVFNNLKSDYPPASLHDCVDGNDENRVFLNQTVV